MPTTPSYLDLAFILITLATTILFWWAIRKSPHDDRKSWTCYFLFGSLIWLGVQGGLAYQGGYAYHLEVLPPRIAVFGMIPALLVILLFFLLPAGRRLIDALPLRETTLLHIIRIPVELVLYGLFVAGTIPEVMTFAGRNFDILAGITAPFMVYWAMQEQAFKKNALIAWNFLSLGLLLSVVVHALLSAPFPLQQLAFDQPNVAVLHFPYVWLPTYVVPIVIFCHLSALRKLFLPDYK